MANRVLRDWTDSDRINNLSAAAEILLLRILMTVDVKGKIKCHPKLLSSRCFPLRTISDKKIIAWLKELSDNDLIEFNCDGKTISLVRTNIGRQRLCKSKWAVLVKEVFARDNYTCRYCGKYGGKLECDHIIAFSNGGTDDLTNLATACKRCNRLKGNLSVESFLTLKLKK